MTAEVAVGGGAYPGGCVCHVVQPPHHAPQQLELMLCEAGVVQRALGAAVLHDVRHVLHSAGVSTLQHVFACPHLSCLLCFASGGDRASVACMTQQAEKAVQRLLLAFAASLLNVHRY